MPVPHAAALVTVMCVQLVGSELGAVLEGVSALIAQYRLLLVGSTTRLPTV